MTGLPSFSDVTWCKFAQHFGLPERLDDHRFVEFATSVYMLPPSVHEIMFEISRVRVLGPVTVCRQAVKLSIMLVDLIQTQYLVCILHLFQGQTINRDWVCNQRWCQSVSTFVHDPHYHPAQIFMISGILFSIPSGSWSYFWKIIWPNNLSKSCVHAIVDVLNQCWTGIQVLQNWRRRHILLVNTQRAIYACYLRSILHHGAASWLFHKYSGQVCILIYIIPNILLE